MQNKNLILFGVLSAAILIGWTFFSYWMWPPKPRPLAERKPEIAKKENSPSVGKVPSKDDLTRASAAALVGSGAATTGLDGLARIAEIAMMAKANPSPPKVEPVPEITQKPPPAKTKPQPNPEIIVMGDDSYNLKATLTSAGAGVFRVELTQFEKANQDGEPVKDRKLNLVFGLEPSYLLYHYKNPDEARPEPTLGNVVWNVKEKDVQPDAEQQKVVFEAEVPGQNLIVTKTYTLARGDYHIGLTVGIRPKPGTKPPQKFRYMLDGAHGLPIEGVWYTYTYRNAMVGWSDSSRALEDSREIAHWDGGERQPRGDSKTIRYAAVAVQYFASAVVVDPEQPGTSDRFIDWVRPTPIGPVHPKRPELTDITVRLVTEPLAVGTKGVEQKYILYNGPIKVSQLSQLGADGKREVDPQLVDWYVDKLQLNTLTDYHSPGPMGTFASSIGLTFLIIKFTNLMHQVLWYLHHILPVWGLDIILLTVLVRGLMFPVSRRQAANSQQMQERMAKLAPEIKKLKEKFKDDMAGMQAAQMELYRRHNINPLSTLGGCLLLFVQMPIFLGLYYCLQESIHFRLQPFLWMKNLAAPDMLFGWGTWIPFISDPASMGSPLYLGPFFNLLPVVAVALMIVQQKMMTPPPTDEQQEMQQKMMKYMMVVFGWMFYKVASGLCIYFIASSLWGLCERKMLPKAKAGMAPGTNTPVVAPDRARSPADRRRQQQRSRREAEANGGTIQKLRDWVEEVLEKAKKK